MHIVEILRGSEKLAIPINLDDAIKNPFLLVALPFVDLSIWNNTQLKKAIIRSILDNLQHDDSDRKLHAIILFDTIKDKFKCPWPELDVIQRYVDDVIQNFELAELYFYARDVRRKPWPGAEPYIMKDPEWAYAYARNVLKQPWPQAEPYIMKDPKYAYYYAKYVLERPWPQAEPLIKQSHIWAGRYYDFVIRFQALQSLKEGNMIKFRKLNEENNPVDDLINSPFTILAMKTVDPVLWSNNQFKKALIKTLLENLQSKKPEFRLLAIHVLEIVKNKHMCPWPELDVIQRYVDNMEDLETYHKYMVQSQHKYVGR